MRRAEAFLPLAALLLGCNATASPQPPGVPVGPAPLTPEVPAPPACGIPACPDTRTTERCFDALWPGGVVYFRWQDREIPWVRAAMNDWEALTRGAIRFQLAPRDHDPPRFPVLTLLADGRGESCSYAGCTRPPYRCEIHLGKGNVYHELGHTLTASTHHFSRYDRPHYVTFHFRPEGHLRCENASFARCGTAEQGLFSDVGPFDYRSTMLYTPTHPDIARFDGSPIVPETACGKGSFAAGRRPLGKIQPTCNECRVAQPNGFPSAYDAAGVVERYLRLADPGWSIFLRTVEEDRGGGAHSPFDQSLAPGVAIPASATPAIEVSPEGAVTLYARGADGQLYTKIGRAPRWAPWVAIGAPAGAGELSDPAAVTVAPGQTALTVRRGAELHLRGKSGSSWGPWVSIGAPPSPPASSPSITSVAPDRLDVFVRGADDHLYRASCAGDCLGGRGRWTAWSAAGTERFFGRPSAVARRFAGGQATIAVLVHKQDHQLGLLNIGTQAGTASDTMSAWETVSTRGPLAFDAACPECFSPAAGARDDGQLEAYVRGDDDMLLRTVRPLNGAWLPDYQPIGGVLTASPAVPAQPLGGNRQAIAAVMAEETTADQFQHGIWVKSYAR
ncbi:MAG: hypothetical protein U0359_16245 [Byssovorax sp.]